MKRLRRVWLPMMALAAAPAIVPSSSMANGADLEESRPATFAEVRRRVWLETLNVLAEYGTLAVFSAGTVAIDTTRRALELPNPADFAIIVFEAVAAVTMIGPRAIRAIGDVAQVLIFTLHDLGYAIRYGSRRPRTD